MRPTRNSIAMMACLLGWMGYAAPANASCWSCAQQVVNGHCAYVCVSAGSGEGGMTQCEPEWCDQDAWCKFSGEPCLGDGSWRPPRYPVALIPKLPTTFTTEVMLFSAAGDQSVGGDRLISALFSEGLGPLESVARLAVKQQASPELLGYSAETNVHRTATRYRADDGSGVSVVAQRMGGGFVVDVAEFGSSETAQFHSPTFVRVGEAAEYMVTVGGKTCALVVHPVPETDGSSNRDAFTRAAEAFPGLSLMGLHIDRPSSDVSEVVRALTSHMLMSSLLSAGR